MSDLYISSTKFSFKDCLKSSKFRLGVVLFIFFLSLFLGSPYVAFGSYAHLFVVSLILSSFLFLFLAMDSVVFEFVRPKHWRNLLLLCTVVLVGFSGVKSYNLDGHVLIDYDVRSEEFLYDSMNLEFASPNLDSSEDLVINVKHKSVDGTADFNSLGSLSSRFSRVYEKRTDQEFRPFTLYWGKSSQGKIGDIKGKRTVYGWFGSTSTDFLIKFD